MDVQAFSVAPTSARAPCTRLGTHSYDDIEPLFCTLVALDADDPRREALRTELIRRCRPLAEHIAAKFAGRGESFDNLLQLARVATVSAVHRFDPTPGSSFLAFATPTIIGELRHHLRDCACTGRAQRRREEIQQTIAPAIDTLSRRLGRIPTAAELAEELAVDLLEVTQAIITLNLLRR